MKEHQHHRVWQDRHHISDSRHKDHQSRLNFDYVEESKHARAAKHASDHGSNVRKASDTGNTEMPVAPPHSHLYKTTDKDTLSGIASKELNKAAEWPKIYALNKERLPKGPNVVFPNHYLVIPDRMDSVASAERELPAKLVAGASIDSPVVKTMQTPGENRVEQSPVLPLDQKDTDGYARTKGDALPTAIVQENIDAKPADPDRIGRIGAEPSPEREPALKPAAGTELSDKPEERSEPGDKSAAEKDRDDNNSPKTCDQVLDFRVPKDLQPWEFKDLPADMDPLEKEAAVVFKRLFKLGYLVGKSDQIQANTMIREKILPRYETFVSNYGFRLDETPEYKCMLFRKPN